MFKKLIYLPAISSATIFEQRKLNGSSRLPDYWHSKRRSIHVFCSGGLFTLKKSRSGEWTPYFTTSLLDAGKKNEKWCISLIGNVNINNAVMLSQKDIWGQGNLEIQTCFCWASLEKLYHVNKLRYLQSASPYIILTIYIQSISLCSLKSKIIKTTSYNLIFLFRRSFSQRCNQSEENDLNCVTLASLRKWRQNIFSCIL